MKGIEKIFFLEMGDVRDAQVHKGNFLPVNNYLVCSDNNLKQNHQMLSSDIIDTNKMLNVDNDLPRRDFIDYGHSAQSENRMSDDVLMHQFSDQTMSIDTNTDTVNQL